MTDVEITAMGPEDWERVRAVRLAALADAPDAFGTLLEEDAALDGAAWRGRLTPEDRKTWLALRGDEALGLVVCAPYEDEAGLFSMWVAPQGRGKGIGDRLVQTVLQWAKAKGYAAVRLGVGDFNEPAIRLYARHGFQPNGKTDALPPPRDHVLEHEREHRFDPN